MKRFKCALIGLAALFSVGCQSLGEVPAAVEPVATHAFPVAGETLVRLSDAFYSLCGRDENRRSAECNEAKAALNKAIETYNALNNVVLEAY